MFDIGWAELLVIGVVALIVIGPKELPAVLRTLGQSMAKIRRMASDFQGQFNDALREAELSDLKKQAEDFKSSVTDISSFDPMADTRRDIDGAFDDAPPPPDVASADAPPAGEPPIDVPPAAAAEPQNNNLPASDFAPSETPATETPAPEPSTKPAGGTA